ncbi:MAG: response regulator [Crocinitomicaceae bacterium]
MKPSKKDIKAAIPVIRFLLSCKSFEESELMDIFDENESFLDDLYTLFNTKRSAQSFNEIQNKIDELQQILFGYAQADFSRKVTIDEENENIGALGYSINILGEELESMHEQEIQNQVKLKNLISELEDAMKIKDSFLAKMSHEMRTPLNSIIGFTELALNSTTSNEDKSRLTIIHDQSLDLLSIINNILDLTKINSDQFSFVPSATDLQELIKSKIDPLEPNAEKRGTRINLNFGQNINSTLLLDKVRFGQIFTNLINNSIKFTEKGEIEINVQLIEESTKNQVIKFSIADTGIGIKKEHIKDVLEPFKQVSNHSGGTGLGLTIVKDLLDQMNSKLFIESEYGIGTRVHFTVELSKANKETIRKDKNDTYNLEKQNILIVDDNPFNRMLINQLLSNWGGTCDEVENGFDAVEAVKEKDYDVIFMDFQMPVMDGFEATETIRKKLCKSTPIIGLTANVVDGTALKSNKAGMNACLIKPIDRLLLVKELEKLELK